MLTLKVHEVCPEIISSGKIQMRDTLHFCMVSKL